MVLSLWFCKNFSNQLCTPVRFLAYYNKDKLLFQKQDLLCNLQTSLYWTILKHKPTNYSNWPHTHLMFFRLIGSFDELMEFFFFALILWACYLFTEQQTMAILMIVKDHISAAIFSIYISSVCITLSSGILR